MVPSHQNIASPMFSLGRFQIILEAIRFDLGDRASGFCEPIERAVKYVGVIGEHLATLMAAPLKDKCDAEEDGALL